MPVIMVTDGIRIACFYFK